MVDWYKLYHNFPYPLRVLTASARGYYLRCWRYGTDTEKLVEEALEREAWSPEHWKKWQEERLAYVLYRAATKVPYYKDYWTKQRRKGNMASWEILENWPILKKEVLRENPLAFLAEDCDFKKMFCDSTSGTSGTPLRLYLKRNTVKQYYALIEARLRRWNNIMLKERWAILGGQRVVPFDQSKPPFWVYNAGLNQLYLSTYHLSARNAESYIDALHRFAPTHMIVYPSSAYVLSLEVLNKALMPPKLKVILSGSELLLDSHKKVISEAFRCPVRNYYGQGETVSAFSECDKGKMHAWPEVGITEVFDDTEDVPMMKEKVGRLIATGLLNADMPLIRYAVGDRGCLDSAETKCACGRTLPMQSAIDGRMNDLILTSDGRRIFWLNPVFYGLPIREAQIIQETLDKIRVLYVPSPDFTTETGQLIIKRLYERVGRFQIILEQVSEVPRGANGKFRAVISHLSTDLDRKKN